MHVGTDLNSCWNHHDKSWQPCSYMIEHVVSEWWNNKIEKRCYNNLHELDCCIKSGFACSTARKTPIDSQSCIQYVETWLNNTVILPTLFYHVNNVVTGLLSQQLCNRMWYFYACTRSGFSWLPVPPPWDSTQHPIWGALSNWTFERPTGGNARLLGFHLEHWAAKLLRIPVSFIPMALEPTTTSAWISLQPRLYYSKVGRPCIR